MTSYELHRYLTILQRRHYCAILMMSIQKCSGNIEISTEISIRMTSYELHRYLTILQRRHYCAILMMSIQKCSGNIEISTEKQHIPTQIYTHKTIIISLCLLSVQKSVSQTILFVLALQAWSRVFINNYVVICSSLLAEFLV